MRPSWLPHISMYNTMSTVCFSMPEASPTCAIQCSLPSLSHCLCAMASHFHPSTSCFLCKPAAHSYSPAPKRITRYGASHMSICSHCTIESTPAQGCLTFDGCGTIGHRLAHETCAADQQVLLQSGMELWFVYANQLPFSALQVRQAHTHNTARSSTISLGPPPPHALCVGQSVPRPRASAPVARPSAPGRQRPAQPAAVEQPQRRGSCRAAGGGAGSEKRGGCAGHHAAHAAR